MKISLITASLIVSLFATASSHADDLFLADGGAFPGKLWLSEGGTVERPIVERAATADRAYPDAIMKLAQAAVGSDGKIFYASGLDGCLMHLLDGRNEIMAFEFAGQIRDLATTGEEHTVYFSVVATPQNDGLLADGVIYRRDLWEGRPSEVARVRQADIGGNWWGAFTIKDGFVYVATQGEFSRIYRLTSSGPELAFDTRVRVTGLTTGADGDFLFTTGDGFVYATRDFERIDTVLQTERRLSDVALRSSPDAVRP
jgi:hypothetical protein